MSTNQIDVYENNDIKIYVDVTGITSLAGYTATLTVKSSKESAVTLFFVTGTISSLRITFDVSALQNDMDRGYYYFEVTITDGTHKYTLVQDVYNIIESLVFHVTGT